jgi:hypothetical protein
MSINRVGESTVVVQSAGVTYVGDGSDQVYTLDSSSLQAGKVITIIDRGGNNKIAFADGLVISSSIVVANEMQLTLSNGALVDIRGADTFTFALGTGKSFSQFATDILGVTLPNAGEAAVTAPGSVTIVNTVSTIAADASAKSFTNTLLDSSLSDTSTFGVSTLDSGVLWDTSSQPITFSFNATMPASYLGDASLTTNWTVLNTAQETATRSIFQGLNSIIGTTVNEVSSDGDIRFNIVDMSANVAGFTASVTDGSTTQLRTDANNGDIFLSSGFNTSPAEFDLNAGGSGWLTIAHELGHAMGLDHPFEGTILATAFDDSNHTIMSYTNNDNTILNFTLANNSLSYTSSIIGSDLYSLYDVESLQAMYGVNTTTNTQDNTYSVTYTDYKVQTIWDAGGVDTIDLSSALGSSIIDLNTATAGTLNSADQYTFQEIVTLQQGLVNDSYFNSFIESNLQSLFDSGKLYTGKNNLGIAQGVIIENVKTGLGADSVTDNKVDNIILTYLGDDKIYLGHGGYDTVDGGGGNDTVFLDVLASQVNMEVQSDGSYILVANNFAASLTGIETIQYSDSSTVSLA